MGKQNNYASILSMSLLLLSMTACSDMDFAPLNEGAIAEKAELIGEDLPLNEEFDILDTNKDGLVSEVEVEQSIVNNNELNNNVESPDISESSDSGETPDSHDSRECQNVKKHLRSIATISGDEIIGHRGILRADAGHLTELSNNSGIIHLSVSSIDEMNNNRGILNLQGKTNTSEAPGIGSIHSGHGITLICDMDVQEVTDFSGILVVVNGSIGSLSGSSGIVRVSKGDIGLVQDHHGIVLVRGGSILDQQNNRGIIKQN